MSEQYTEIAPYSRWRFSIEDTRKNLDGTDEIFKLGGTAKVLRIVDESVLIRWEFNPSVIDCFTKELFLVCFVEEVK